MTTPSNLHVYYIYIGAKYILCERYKMFVVRQKDDLHAVR